MFLSGKQFEMKASNDHRQHHLRFQHGEILADARASARGERQVNVVVTLIEARWVEFPRIRPEFLRAEENKKREMNVRPMSIVLLMQIENIDHHVTSFLHIDDFAVAGSETMIFDRRSSEQRHRLVEAKRFF